MYKSKNTENKNMKILWPLSSVTERVFLICLSKKNKTVKYFMSKSIQMQLNVLGLQKSLWETLGS